MTGPAFPVVELCDDEDKARACTQITETLPEWFGQPDSNAAYAQAIRTKDAFAVRDGQVVVALLALKYHFEDVAEVWWMGIRRSHHRRGLGTKLMAAAEVRARQRGCRYMCLMTLSPRSRDPGYAATRAFYLAARL